MPSGAFLFSCVRIQCEVARSVAPSLLLSVSASNVSVTLGTEGPNGSWGAKAQVFPHSFVRERGKLSCREMWSEVMVR